MADDRNNPQFHLAFALAGALLMGVLSGCGQRASDDWALGSPVLEPDVRFENEPMTTVALTVTDEQVAD